MEHRHTLTTRHANMPRFFILGLATLVLSGLLAGLYSDEVYAAAKNLKTKVVTAVQKKTAPIIKTVKKSVPQKKKVSKKPKKQKGRIVAVAKKPTLPIRPLSDQIPDIVLPPTEQFNAPTPLIFIGEPIPQVPSSTPLTQSTSSTPTSTAPSTPQSFTSTQAHQEPFIVRIPRPDFTLLTRDGILQWTNIQRATTASLPPLLGNGKLDAVAQARLIDLFEKQYFEHVSPDGSSASSIAKDIGYSFILIGENLALGDFGSDERVVQAWMDSPGHRANILNTKYSELGVAAQKGTYQGRETWIAVQIFGLPLSTCPQPDQEIKTKIVDSERAVAEMKTVLAWKKQGLESIGAPTTQSAVDAYNALVNEHNTIVEQMNALIANIKLWVTAYNEQIAIFNDCLKSATPQESTGH